MTMTETYVGVDIAKDWIDIFDDGQARRITMAPQALKRFASGCADKCVVFEASGGYERPLIDALAAQERFGFNKSRSRDIYRPRSDVVSVGGARFRPVFRFGPI